MSFTMWLFGLFIGTVFRMAYLPEKGKNELWRQERVQANGVSAVGVAARGRKPRPRGG